MKIIMPLLKLGTAGGAVYLAAEQGLFSHNQKETIEASKKIKTVVNDLDAYEMIPKFVLRDIKMNDIAVYWNTGVKGTTSALASLPTDARDLFSRGFHFLKKELRNQVKNVETQ